MRVLIKPKRANKGCSSWTEANIVLWALAKTLSGDQSASRLVCCSASWQLWRGTVILESPVHFWGFWQKSSSVELSLLSWSVTSYRQTLVPDGFCSCTRLRQTDVMPVRAEVVLPCKPSYQNSECRKEIYIDMYYKEAGNKTHQF